MSTGTPKKDFLHCRPRKTLENDRAVNGVLLRHVCSNSTLNDKRTDLVKRCMNNTALSESSHVVMHHYPQVDAPLAPWGESVTMRGWLSVTSQLPHKWRPPHSPLPFCQPTHADGNVRIRQSRPNLVAMCVRRTSASPLRNHSLPVCVVACDAKFHA